MAAEEELQARGGGCLIRRTSRQPAFDSADGIGSRPGLQIEIGAGKEQVELIGLLLQESVVHRGRPLAFPAGGQEPGQFQAAVAVTRRERGDSIQPFLFRFRVALRFGEGFQTQVAAEIARGLFDGAAPPDLQFRRAAGAFVEANDRGQQFTVQPVVARGERQAALVGVPRGVELAAAFVQPARLPQGGDPRGGVGVPVDVFPVRQRLVGQPVAGVGLRQLLVQGQIRRVRRDELFPGFGGLRGLTRGQPRIARFQQQVGAAAVVGRNFGQGVGEQSRPFFGVMLDEGDLSPCEQWQHAGRICLAGCVVGGGGVIEPARLLEQVTINQPGWSATVPRRAVPVLLDQSGRGATVFVGFP